MYTQACHIFERTDDAGTVAPASPGAELPDAGFDAESQWRALAHKQNIFLQRNYTGKGIAPAESIFLYNYAVKMVFACERAHARARPTGTPRQIWRLGARPQETPALQCRRHQNG